MIICSGISILVSDFTSFGGKNNSHRLTNVFKNPPSLLVRVHFDEKHSSKSAATPSSRVLELSVR